jgi:hypothetical protein
MLDEFQKKLHELEKMLDEFKRKLNWLEKILHALEGTFKFMVRAGRPHAYMHTVRVYTIMYVILLII